MIFKIWSANFIRLQKNESQKMVAYDHLCDHIA